jgi:hypothetical protein
MGKKERKRKITFAATYTRFFLSRYLDGFGFYFVIFFGPSFFDLLVYVSGHRLCAGCCCPMAEQDG